MCIFLFLFLIILYGSIFLESTHTAPTATMTRPEATTTPTSECGSPNWQGDKVCDDRNNNAGCDYDGGDCCGDFVDTSYCKICH